MKYIIAIILSLMLVLPAYASEVIGGISTGISTGVSGTVMEAPTAFPVAGAYTTTQNVVLSGGEGTTSIHYTIDGSAVTCSSGNVYSSPIGVASSLSIKAISCYPNGAVSNTAVFEYAIQSTTPANHQGSSGGGWSDTTPPLNTSVLINNNDESTASVAVTLTLSATDASKMMIASSSDFADANWESYAVEKNWVLTEGNGEKTVYAKFKDAAGNISNPTQDTIVLEEIIVKGVESDYRTIQLQRISEDAGVVYAGDADLTCGQTGVKRDAVKERGVYDKYTVPLLAGVSGLADNHIYAITNFVFCGTETTLILGEGERAGVVNSYKAAFGKLPATRSEWDDVIKIANGRWPSERSVVAEARAKKEFKTVYLRVADMDNSNDNAAVTIIAYGLRPDNRNLDSEKIAIKTFKAIYGYNPTSAIDWDITRAIAYSGAVR
ncbi:MAG: hypothetical protein GXO85_11330 [Chlorobi bacterium]|nr:hypothetical protein [Chlorobiota bacterium]